mmetsp:Transcript_6546/g.16171  ORF Transcript_6546/g.16171 Transcript_6546/m.16171 type:complete len:278 (-) Transcript_6546:1299-2132(-)
MLAGAVPIWRRAWVYSNLSIALAISIGGIGPHRTAGSPSSDSVGGGFPPSGDPYLTPLVATPSEEMPLHVDRHAVRLTACDVLHAAFLQRHNSDWTPTPPKVEITLSTEAVATLGGKLPEATRLHNPVGFESRRHDLARAHRCRSAYAELPELVRAEGENCPTTDFLHVAGDAPLWSVEFTLVAAALRQLAEDPLVDPAGRRARRCQRRARLQAFGDVHGGPWRRGARDAEPFGAEVEHVVALPPGPENAVRPQGSLVGPQHLDNLLFIQRLVAAAI